MQSCQAKPMGSYRIHEADMVEVGKRTRVPTMKSNKRWRCHGCGFGNRPMTLVRRPRGKKLYHIGDCCFLDFLAEDWIIVSPPKKRNEAEP